MGLISLILRLLHHCHVKQNHVQDFGIIITFLFCHFIFPHVFKDVSLHSNKCCTSLHIYVIYNFYFMHLHMISFHTFMCNSNASSSL
jgi:hypothetical protein